MRFFVELLENYAAILCVLQMVFGLLRRKMSSKTRAQIMRCILNTKSVRLSLRTNRFTAAHERCRLMLLGSPPDMVHGGPSHRTRTSAYLKARIFWLYIRFLKSHTFGYLFYHTISKISSYFYSFCIFFCKLSITNNNKQKPFAKTHSERSFLNSINLLPT